MPTETETLVAKLSGLRDIRARGVSELVYNGEKVVYRTDAEIAAAIADIERQLANLNRSPVRRIVVATTKGF